MKNEKMELIIFMIIIDSFLSSNIVTLLLSTSSIAVKFCVLSERESDKTTPDTNRLCEETEYRYDLVMKA